ncbi:MAG: DUF4012 domain-containing protein [Chloroflexi bacterium]|nr:DUF4012 domain-containing protein [Chloroflexota bacterium]
MTTADTGVPTGRSKRKFIGITILLVGLLVVGWLGLKAWRINRATQSLLAQRPQLESLAAAGLTGLDPDAAEQLVLDVRRDVLTLKKETAVFMPLTPYLGWVPRVGSTLVIAPQLLEMATAGLDTAAYSVRGLKPALTIIQQGGGPQTNTLAALVQVVAAAEPDLRAANDAFTRVVAARAAVGDTAVLPGQLQTLFAQADVYLPLAQDGLQFALIAPEMMGINGPRTYLVVAQNEDEMRPTGGYISGAGVIAVSDGRIQDFDFDSAFAVDNYRDKPYDIPPEPLEKFMGLDLFLFRDANFWPDFPTSAEKMMDLYSYGRDLPPLDGAVAVDQRFLHLLIEAIGPVAIPEDDIVLDQNNLTEALRQAWGADEGQTAVEWVGNRKDFLGPFAAAIKSKIETDFGSLDLALLGKNMDTALQTGHLQVYSRYPQEEAVLDELGWNGRLTAAPRTDFLAVVDTNVGYSKANLYVEMSADYRVRLQPEGAAAADLRLQYTHTHPNNGQACVHYNIDIYAQLPDYLTLADACLWNYLRLYVPAGSQLISATEHIIPGEAHRFGQTWQGAAQTIPEMPNLTTFATYFLLPTGQTVNSQFQYTLPTVVEASGDGRQTYQLNVVKQAGSRAYPLTISVTLPPGRQFLAAAPAPTAVNGQTVQFQITVDTDVLITLQYQ